MLHPAHRAPRFGEIGVSPKGSPIEVYIANFPWGKYLGGQSGVDVCISSWNRLAPNTLPSLAKPAPTT